MPLRDLSFALRQLRRAPGYSLAVVLTLTLAIGANTAVFSLVDGFLLRSLPFPEPDRVGAIITHLRGVTDRGSVAEDDDAHDLAEWRAIHENTPSLLSATAQGGESGVNLRTPAASRHVLASRVSADYFDVIGIRPRLGRGFSEQEDLPGGPRVVVLSDALWRSSFAGDPAILGKPIFLKGEAYTVVGVLPAGAQMPSAAQLWIPQRPTDPKGECADGDNCSILVRLRPGASWQKARAELGRLHTARFDRVAKLPNGGAWFSVRPLEEELSAGVAEPLRALMLAVGMILLIGSANLAGLALVRVTRRTPELATRLALGARHSAVLLQLWVESLVLATVGAGCGLALAEGLLRLAARTLPPEMLPLGGLQMDLRVLLFAIAVSVGASVCFGLLPALQLRRVEIRSVLGSRSVVAGRRRLRQVVLGAEVALTLVLLASAGLLIRSLIHLQTLAPGFDPNHVMTAKASIDDARYRVAGNFQPMLGESVAALRAIPGVTDAAVGLSVPYERGLNNVYKLTDGPETGTRIGASTAWVTAGYFSTLRIPLVSGRLFTDSDTPNSERVAVVNESFSRRYLQGGDLRHPADPLGRHVDAMRVVGVVADVAKAPGMEVDAPISTEPVIYTLASQTAQADVNMGSVWVQPNWIVRTSGDLPGIREAMGRALASVDPGLPISGFFSMADLQGQQLAIQRLLVHLLSALAGLALLLSGLGIYSLVANLVAERTREIGIRLALGSSIADAMVTVGSSGLLACLAGVGAGSVLALVALRLLRSQVYGVPAWDPVVLVLTPMTLLLLGLLASTLPALRISRIDPAETLRAE